MTWEIYYYEYNYFSAPGFKEYYFSHFFYYTYKTRDRTQ